MEVESGTEEMLDVYYINCETVYEVASGWATFPHLNMVVPISGRIRDDGFDATFFDKGKERRQGYSFLNVDVVRKVCLKSELGEKFPEYFV